MLAFAEAEKFRAPFLATGASCLNMLADFFPWGERSYWTNGWSGGRKDPFVGGRQGRDGRTDGRPRWTGDRPSPCGSDGLLCEGGGLSSPICRRPGHLDGRWRPALAGGTRDPALMGQETSKRRFLLSDRAWRGTEPAVSRGRDVLCLWNPTRIITSTGLVEFMQRKSCQRFRGLRAAQLGEISTYGACSAEYECRYMCRQLETAETPLSGIGTTTLA